MASEMWYMMAQNSISDMCVRLDSLQSVMKADVERNPDTNRLDPQNDRVLADIVDNLDVLSQWVKQCSDYIKSHSGVK